MSFTYTLTFESEKGEPTPFRGRLDDSSPDEAARKAIFRALPLMTGRKWESLVVVLTKEEAGGGTKGTKGRETGQATRHGKGTEDKGPQGLGPLHP